LELLTRNFVKLLVTFKFISDRDNRQETMGKPREKFVHRKDGL